ncbi:uncharacterized protein FIESC28_01278 [Fusarium coffeatum]|uniref:Uncharacterized protein n=1 Tax=Fusarium coffeatum TaxID=231269 RepID=A0A366SBL3_9HYPO|nr:uncharacterized protein FIESC28_01278 [Fusarium coffeatum]RBR26005.1 hypothetical protein FIESC28_01278 [Fusarium coffeatum]
MHSAIFALVAISGLAASTPNPKTTECQGLGPDLAQYYVCGNNGFRGYCSVDPCDKKWCRDFVPKTCDLVFITEPEPPVVANPVDGHEHEWEAETTTTEPTTEATPSSSDDTVCAPGTGFFQSCSNGFRGCCKSDACSNSEGVCPDTVKRSDPTVCAPGTGFFQSCSNGFRGCCKTDACSNSAGICPPVAKRSDPTVCPPGTGFFQSCSNGFRGCCKGDACGQKEPICPTTVNKRSDPTVCPPGTGFFQSCSNGFRGCCKTDACSQKQPICPPAVAKRSDDTVCPPNTGFFQSCSNGFRGCCKGDACGNTWCPDYKTGTYQPAQSLEVKTRSSGTCAPGTGFFQVCANGFKGCCKKDACSSKRPVCPK